MIFHGNDPLMQPGPQKQRIGQRQTLGALTVGITATALTVGATTMALTTSLSSLLPAFSVGGQPVSSAVHSTTAPGSARGSNSTSPGDSSPSDQGRRSRSPALSTAQVTRGQLVENKRFSGTVNYGESWQLPTSVAGVVTEAPTVGTTMALNTVVLRVNNLPVVLAEGGMPMYRTLEKVNTKNRDKYGARLTLLTGYDVWQLQTFLISQGFTAGGKMVADGTFNDTTTKAVKEWQKATGLPMSGKVDSSQMVFSPSPLRAAETLRLGTKFAGLKVTDINPAVWVTTSSHDRGLLEPDQQVTIEQPDGSTVTGRVIRQERGTADDGSPTWKSQIQPDQPLALDVESVAVDSSRVLVDDSLIVPTGALVALAEGGFAVEVVESSGTQYVRVEIIDVYEDRAAVGGDVAVGAEVVTAE